MAAPSFSTPSLPHGLVFFLSNLHSYVTVKLDSSNFIQWKQQLQSALKANNLLGYVDGSLPCPKEEITDSSGKSELNPAFTEWTNVDNHLISCITTTLSPLVLPYIIDCHHRSDVWEVLKEQFMSLSVSHVHELKTKLFNLQKGDLTIEKYIEAIKEVTNKLAATGSPLPEDDVVFYTLHGLPSEFSSFKCTIRTRAGSIKIGELNSLLASKETNLALEAWTQPQSKISMTFTCSTHGGSSRDGCWNYRNQNQIPQQQQSINTSGSYFQQPHRGRGHGGSSPRGRGGCGSFFTRLFCYICGRTNHLAPDCYYRSELMYSPFQACSPRPNALVATTPSLPDSNWYVDTGATNHITGDLSNMSFHNEYHGGASVAVGNGQSHEKGHLQGPL